MVTTTNMVDIINNCQFPNIYTTACWCSFDIIYRWVRRLNQMTQNPTGRLNPHGGYPQYSLYFEFKQNAPQLNFESNSIHPKFIFSSTIWNTVPIMWLEEQVLHLMACNIPCYNNTESACCCVGVVTKKFKLK